MSQYIGTHYKVLGVNMSVLDRKTFVERTKTIIKKNQEKIVIYTPYSEFIYKAFTTPQFRDVLNSADLNLADGVFIQIASLYYEKVKKSEVRIINFAKLIILILRMVLRKVDRSIVFPELLSGSTEIKTICEMAQKEGFNIYFVGGMQNVVFKAVQNLKNEFPDLNIAGKQIGTIGGADDQKLFEDLKNVSPDILLLCYGSRGKPETWVYNNRSKIHAKVTICLGGTFDYISGKRKLQSEWWSDHGLNWLHRLLSDPWRWKRQIDIFKLLWILAGEKNRH